MPVKPLVFWWDALSYMVFVPSPLFSEARQKITHLMQQIAANADTWQTCHGHMQGQEVFLCQWNNAAPMLDLCVDQRLTFFRIRFLWAACFFVGHWFLAFVWRAVYSSVLLPVQTAPPGPRQRLFECGAFHYCLSAETVGSYYMQVNILFERVQSLRGQWWRKELGGRNPPETGD